MKYRFWIGSMVAVVSALGVSSVYFLQRNSSPYSGLEQRKIKSLSEQDIASLREGKGMGYALSAELNGYPGPKHVLELAIDLNLTSEQATRTKELFHRMQTEAKELGAKRIAAEEALDEGFSSRTLDETRLRKLTADSSRVDGELRATHLKYHLAMLEVLSPDQVKAYVNLRGCNETTSNHTGH
jgi:Spy/CpxP family protein refolding chaperone